MAEEGQVIACHTVQTWTQQLQKANDSKKLVVVDFTATWCPPCRVIAPVFAEFAKKIPDAVFLKVDVDELKQIAEEWEVEAMPTFLFLKEGKSVDKLVGANRVDLEKKITRHVTAASASS